MTFAEWQTQEAAEDTTTVQARVVASRTRQIERQGALNGRLDAGAHRKVSILDPAARDLLAAAVTRYGWSARSTTRVVRVARTVADLAGSAVILPVHLAEALQFRGNERLT